MELDEASEMCKKLKCTANITVYIADDGNITVGAVSVWGAKRNDILEYKRTHGIRQLKKNHVEGWTDIDWKFDNVTFNKVEECKILGYKEEKVSEHVRKVPIIECDMKPIE